MRLIAVLLPLLSATLVASSSLSLFGDQAPIAGKDNDEKLKVPGKNPLYVRSAVPASHDAFSPTLTTAQFCADPSDYILSIDFVDLDPNPPTP